MFFSHDAFGMADYITLYIVFLARHNAKMGWIKMEGQGFLCADQ